MSSLALHHVPADALDRSSPRTVRLAVALSLAQALWMLAAVNFIAPHYSDLLTGDMAYFLGAVKHVLAGEMPYRDFSFEYPPGALVPMVLPAIFSGTTTVSAYIWAFVAQNALLAGVITLLLAKWSGLRAAVSFNVLLAIGAAFVPLRFDLLPALLTLVAVKWAIDRPARAGAVLALGVLVKLYPAVLLPILLLPHVANRNWKAIGRSLGAFAGTLLVVLVPVAILSHNHLFDFLAFHRARGLQIESVAGGWILLASKWRLTSAEVGTSFFSSNVSGPWVSLVLKLLQPALLVMLVVQWIMLWRLWRGTANKACELAFAATENPSESRRSDIKVEELRGLTITPCELALAATTAFWIFIAANKVFSPQYVVWVLPLGAMTNIRVRYIAAIAVLTAAVFPFLYDSLKQIDMLPVVLVNVRNLLVIAMIVYGLATRPKNKISPL